MYRFDGSTVLVIHIDVTHTVTHQTTHILPPPGRKTLSTRATRRRPHSKPLGRSRCSLDAGERMAHALDGGEAKTPMVAVRWRERRRSRPHPSRRRPNLTRRQPNPTQCNPTQPKKHDSQVGPSASGCKWGGFAAAGSPAVTPRTRRGEKKPARLKHARRPGSGHF